MEKKLKGLMVDILRPAHGQDFSRGGISSKSTRVLLVGNDIAEIFDDDGIVPVMRLVSRHISNLGQVFHAEPVEKCPDNACRMFGGNFVFSSDSRFRRIAGGPIAIHDRDEVQSRTISGEISAVR